MLLQLDPPIPMEAIGKGRGYAIMCLDYGQEHHVMWAVALDANGEIWWTDNTKVRLLKNWALDRRQSPA